MRVIGDLSRLAARRFPRKTALVGGGVGLTFAEIDEASNRLAHAFVAAGVTKGDRVALIAPNHPAYVIPAQAAAKCGAIIVPLNHRYTAAELRGPLEQSDPKILVFGDELRGVVDEALAGADAPPRLLRLHGDERPDVPTIAQFSQGEDGSRAPDMFVSPDDPATIMFTSGTTGQAKGVLYGHGAHFQLFEAQAIELGIGAGDVLHISSGLYTNAGINGGINAMMMVGGMGVVHVGSFVPEVVLDAVQEHRVTINFWVPTMLAMLRDALATGAWDTSSLRRIFCGSMPMPASVYEETRRLLPHVELYQLYGSTECGFGGVLPPGDHDGRRTSRPAYNADMRIVGADGAEVPVGGVGEIVVRQASQGMMGYWRNEAATAEAIRDGWIRSGDLARQEEDCYFTLVDRTRDMIISGAHNIYSSEVEQALAAHPAVREVAVFGIPDERYGELVCAAIVLEEGAEASAEELDAHCLSLLARYKRPRRFDFHAELPKTSNGKILKRALRDAYWAGHARAI